MRATVCLEYIGEGAAALEKLYSGLIRVASGGRDAGCEIAKMRRPWVAEITGTHPKFGFERHFLRGNWQRRRSSSTGNRGVEIWYILESGKIYQVQHYTSWKRRHRYFVTVDEAGEITERDEAWVKSHLALMSSPPHGSA